MLNPQIELGRNNLKQKVVYMQMHGKTELGHFYEQLP